MEFLFENPFLIIILIGIISSLFKRVKGEQEQQPKRRPNPPMQQGQNPDERMPRESKPLSRTQSPKTKSPVKDWEPSSVPENPFLDIQKKYEERRRESTSKRNNPQPSYERSKPSVKVNKEINDSPGDVSIDLNPEADRVIEGIAWAQVLGPPRSRNPYHRDRRR